MGLIPGSGRSPGEGKGNLLQYSCLKTLWTEEPGRLQSVGVTELNVDLATNQPTVVGMVLLRSNA